MRRCVDCGQDLPLAAFYRHSNGRHYQTRCKRCHNARSLRNQQAQRARDPEGWYAHHRAVDARYRERRRTRQQDASKTA